MASHISDEDEDYDDPIKLFDSTEDAVYFGSNVYEKSTTTIDFTWRSEKSPTDPVSTSPIEPSSGTSDHLRQLSVKLVDCGQFPWYYRKYTQQILDLTGIELDSDSEVDIEGLDNSLDENDCIIVEGMKNVFNNKTNVMNYMESVLAATRLSQTREKRQNTLRLKEEFEIQRALSLKNTIQVDLKRNQGLVGMKIKNLPVSVNIKKNKKVNKQGSNQGDKTVDNVYVHAADKVLQHIGTELIPIVEHKNEKFQAPGPPSSVSLTIEGSKKTTIENPTSLTKDNSSSQKNINKICERLLDSMKTKSIPEVASTNIKNTAEINVMPITEPTMEISKLEIIPIAVPLQKSQNSVKDVTKTNKFKNDLLKNQNRALKEKLIFKPNDEKGEVSNKNDQIHVETSAINATLKTHDDKSKYEPNSPILPSSNLLTKCKSKRGISSQCISGNSLCSASQGSDKLNKNKLSFTELFGGESDKIIDAVPKNAKPSSLLQDVTQEHNLHSSITKVSEKLVQKGTDGTATNLKKITSNYKESITNGHKDTVPVMKKARKERKAIEPNMNMVVANNVNTRYVRKNVKKKPGPASIKNTSLSNETDKQNFIGIPKNDATVFLHSYKPTHNARANLPNPNCVPNMKTHLTNLNKDFEQSFPISSYLTQKPNIQTTTPTVSHQPHLPHAENNQKTNVIRKPMHISIPSQPRCPYNLKDRIPPHSQFPCRYSQYVHSAANDTQSSLSNNMTQKYFPYYRSSDYPKFPAQRQHVNDWQSQNAAHFASSLNPQLTSQKSAYHGNPLGPQYIGSPFHSIVQKTLNVPGSSIPTHAYYLEANNFPVINNDKDNCKKTNSNIKPNKDDANKIKHNLEKVRTETPSANAEVVATKTEMLKELDKLSFEDNAKNGNLKRQHPDDPCEMKSTNVIQSSDVLKKTTKVNDTFKAPLATTRNDSKFEVHNKYSPPILPIPRYDKVLEHIADPRPFQNNDPRRQNNKSNITADKVSKQKPISEIKPAQNTLKRCRKGISYEFKEPTCGRRKCDGKKISLEEYKQRVYVKSASEVSKRRMAKDCDKKYKPGPGSKKYKKHSNNAESDLGYDSDSTVVL